MSVVALLPDLTKWPSSDWGLPFLGNIFVQRLDKEYPYIYPKPSMPVIDSIVRRAALLLASIWLPAVSGMVLSMNDHNNNNIRSSTWHQHHHRTVLTSTPLQRHFSLLCSCTWARSDCGWIIKTRTKYSDFLHFYNLKRISPPVLVLLNCHVYCRSLDLGACPTICWLTDSHIEPYLPTQPITNRNPCWHRALR